MSPDPQSGFPSDISTLEAFSSFPPIPEATALILHHSHLAFAEISKRSDLFLHPHFSVLRYLSSMLHQFTS